MLTIQECLKFLSTGCSLTSTEVEMLRDELYAIAQVGLRGLPQWGIFPEGLRSTSI